MLLSPGFSSLIFKCYPPLKMFNLKRNFSSTHLCSTYFNMINQNRARTHMCPRHRNNKDYALLSGIPLLSRKSPAFNNFYHLNFVYLNFFSFQSVSQVQANLFSFLSESAPTQYAQMFFQYVHDTSGLPWWGSIIFTTIFVRAAVAFPLAMYQNYILAKFQNLQIDMIDVSKELQKEVAFASKKFGWSKEQAQLQYRCSLKKQWDKLVVRDNCHPFKASLPIWFQMPMWIFLSVSLRNMAYMLPYHDAAAEIIFLQLSAGGCLWFPNLIDIDHTFILPVTLGVLNLAIVELQTITKIKKSTRFQRYLTNFFRILSIVMIPVAANVPTCMSLYWVTSSACGLAQNLLVLSPRLKRWAYIPEAKPLPSISQGEENAPSPAISPTNIGQQAHLQNHPYRHIALEIKARICRIADKIGIRKCA